MLASEPSRRGLVLNTRINCSVADRNEAEEEPHSARKKQSKEGTEQVVVTKHLVRRPKMSEVTEDEIVDLGVPPRIDT